MLEVALGVSGHIGSGKTSLAIVLAERLDCPRASFGDYVRSVASDRGLDAGRRDVLQAVGDELIANGWDTFCTAVLMAAGYTAGSVVVDGIRHAVAAKTMQKLLAPAPWKLVAVESEEATRRSRLTARGIDARGAAQADAHPNEREVASVLASADLVVSSDTTVEAAADMVMAWLT